MILQKSVSTKNDRMNSSVLSCTMGKKGIYFKLSVKNSVKFGENSRHAIKLQNLRQNIHDSIMKYSSLR